MGTRNGCLAHMVDEIPDFCPSIPPATSEPLLVLLDLEDLIPVCQVDHGVRIELRRDYSTLFTGNPDDDRSDDEDDDEGDTRKE